MKLSPLYFFLSLFIILLSFSNLNAQTQNTDSLIALLPNMPDDTNKVKVLHQITYNYSYNDAKKELYFQELELKLSIKIGYKKGIARSYIGLASYYISQHELKPIDTLVKKSLGIFKELNDYSGMAQSYSILGTYYHKMDQYENALINYQLAYDLSEKAHDETRMASATGSMALIFSDLERFDEAEKYYLKSLSIREKIQDIRGICIALTNLGTIKMTQNENDKALIYFNRCLSYEKKGVDLKLIGTCRLNMAYIFSEYKLYDEAEKMYDQCYKIYEQIGDTFMISYVWLYRATDLRKSGHVDNAIQCLDKSMAILQKYDLEKAAMSSIYEEYYYCYKATGDYQKALDYYEKMVESTSDLFSTETTDKISELKEKYETEKKEQENIALKNESVIKELRLNQQQYLIYGMIGIILFVILVFFLLIRTNRIATKQQNMQLEQRLLRSQMNPHFIFNSLTAIQGYIYKKDPTSAGKFLSSFAKLIRSILDNSREEYISIYNEISWTNNYLELQKLRFENQFEYVLEVDAAIDQENTLIPPMLTQPFIENALEHGLSKKERGGLLEVIFSKTNDGVQVKITDNGTGFSTDTSSKPISDHNSLATVITRERLTLLNRGKKRKIGFSVHSMPGNGTVVTIFIPYKTKL